jgi:hypothetical protein
MYLDRHEENQRKRQLIGAKIKSHYNQLQNEKEARSTKFLTKAIPTRKRRSEYSSGSNASKWLFTYHMLQNRLFLTIVLSRTYAR